MTTPISKTKTEALALMVNSALDSFYEDYREQGSKITIAFAIMQLGYSEDVAAETITRLTMEHAFIESIFESGDPEHHDYDSLMDLVGCIALAQAEDMELLQ